MSNQYISKGRVFDVEYVEFPYAEIISGDYLDCDCLSFEKVWYSIICRHRRENKCVNYDRCLNYVFKHFKDNVSFRCNENCKYKYILKENEDY